MYTPNAHLIPQIIDSQQFSIARACAHASVQDKLAPLLMRNAPAAAVCFALNALVLAHLGHFMESEAGAIRTAAIWAAACAAQTAIRRALTLAPIPAPWPKLSGDSA